MNNKLVIMSLLSLVKESNIRFDSIEDRVVPNGVEMGGWLLLLIPAFIITMIFGISVAEAGFSFSFLLVVLGFWASPYIAIKLNQKVLWWLIDHANSTVGPPHEVIDDFVRWKEGDQIKTDHFSGSYEGLDQNQRIILSYCGNYKCLSTGYFDISKTVFNKSMQKRKRKEAEQRIEREIEEETEYENLLKEFEKEYESLKSENKITA